MSDATVREILDRIEQLSDEDRLEISMRLAERTESEWQEEVEAARRTAREKRITQATIDQAIGKIRYGQ